MKNQHVTLIATLLIAVSLFMGCEKSPEQKEIDLANTVKDARQDLKEAQAQFEKEWQQFKIDAELKITANEKKIDAIKTEMKNTAPKFKDKYPEIHGNVSNLLQSYAQDNMILIPQSSSFMIHVKKR